MIITFKEAKKNQEKRLRVTKGIGNKGSIYKKQLNMRTETKCGSIAAISQCFQSLS